MTENDKSLSIRDDGALVAAGRAADAAAAVNLFTDYRERKSAATRRAHDAALDLFARYLGDAKVVVDPGEMATSPGAWSGVTWGLVAGFVRWQSREGYAVSSINARLSHVKAYARLAHQAGALGTDVWLRVQTVAGYSGTEAARIDETRQDAGRPTRRGAKKDGPVTITDGHARALLDQPSDTPQGRRDRLIMHLLLVHGLRVSELAVLRVGDIVLDDVGGLLKFYRPKMAGRVVAGRRLDIGEHTLNNGALDAARAYIEHDAPESGPLLRASSKSGRLTVPGMTTRRISERVRVLGERVGLRGLSAHDCRHFSATKDAPRGVRYLMDKYSWTSADTAMRYVAPSTVVEVNGVLERSESRQE